MAFRGEIGNLTQKQDFKKYFKWTIANFLSFLRKSDIQIVSPTFQFQCQHCALGLQIFEDEEWIAIHVLISPKNYLIRVKLGILGPDEKEYKSVSVQNKGDDPRHHLYEVTRFLQKSDLNKVLNFGALRVFCEIEQGDSEQEVLQTDVFDGILAA